MTEAELSQWLTNEGLDKFSVTNDPSRELLQPSDSADVIIAADVTHLSYEQRKFLRENLNGYLYKNACVGVKFRVQLHNNYTGLTEEFFLPEIRYITITGTVSI